MPRYISNGKYIEITEHTIPFDHEFAQELARLFKDKIGMEFKQSRFILLPSRTQNNLVRDASIEVQRKRRKQK